MLKRWLVAVRPFAYTASVLAVAMGAAIAHYTGHPIHWGMLVVTLVGVVCFHTGANLMNDCFDHRRGLDTQILPTSGAIVRGWLTETQVFRAAVAMFAVGTVCGAILTWYAGWVVLLLGALGAVCAFGYTTSRLCFKYMGGGDIVVFLAFGALPVFGAFWVQARVFSWLPVLWSIPLASFTVAILHANNWRDIARDGDTGCLTVAGILGSSGSARYYRMLILTPFAFVVFGVMFHLARMGSVGGPATAIVALLSLPLAVRLARVRPDRDAATFAMLDGKTAQLHLLFGALISFAFFFGRLL
jgi:1,4-dihydroxy-2-naphthoate octaprenyltransferase